jgi:hypothetical protein
MCAVGEEGTPSARMPLPSPTGKRRLLAKSGWQRERQLCQQLALPRGGHSVRPNRSVRFLGHLQTSVS